MESVYRFRCPRCATWTVKNAGPNVITLLLRNGARVEHWRPGIELDEQPVSWLAPLNEADLSAFLAALEQMPTADRDLSATRDDRFVD